MIIDTHVHYNLEPLSFDAASHLAKAQRNGVYKSIVVGTDWESINKAVSFAQEHDGLYASIGYHPTNYQHKVESSPSNISSPQLFEALDIENFQLKSLIEKDKVVAIGETGLDYYRLSGDHPHKELIISLQKYAFRQQIQLAKEYDLPLICHVRDTQSPEVETSGNAYWDALKLLKQYKCSKFTLHCVSGPLSYIQQAIEMGGYMGFDGNITYPKAQDIRKIFDLVPEDKRLVETDAPYLPPQEFRGKVCEPWMISKTAEYIEQVLDYPMQKLTKNAETLFTLG